MYLFIPQTVFDGHLNYKFVECRLLEWTHAYRNIKVDFEFNILNQNEKFEIELTYFFVQVSFNGNIYDPIKVKQKMLYNQVSWS